MAVYSKSTSLNKERTPQFFKLSGNMRLLPVAIALLVIWTVFQIMNPSFLSARNLTLLSVQIVNTSVMAIALFLVLLHGELDLSCATSSLVCASLCALLYTVRGVPFALCVLACIGCGALIGLVQGWLVTAFRAPAFIITMGTKMALNALLLMLLKNHMQISLIGTPMVSLTTIYVPQWVSWLCLTVAVLVVTTLEYSSYRRAQNYALNVSFAKKVVLPSAAILLLGSAALGIMSRYKGLSLSVLLLLLLTALIYYMLTQTRFGIHLYALGGNPEAVRRAGINVKTTKIAAFVLSGVIVALAGLVSASRVQSVAVSGIDENIMMNALAACVLGGASLSGGKGNVWGILLGALVMGSLTNGLYLIGAETAVRLAIQGAILVAAVVMDSTITKKLYQ